MSSLNNSYGLVMEQKENKFGLKNLKRNLVKSNNNKSQTKPTTILLLT